MAEKDSTGTQSGRKQAQRTINADKCSKCGSTKKLERHHMDKDTANNGTGNVKILCSKCHTALHQRNGDRPIAAKDAAPAPGRATTKQPTQFEKILQEITAKKSSNIDSDKYAAKAKKAQSIFKSNGWQVSEIMDTPSETNYHVYFEAVKNGIKMKVSVSDRVTSSSDLFSVNIPMAGHAENNALRIANENLKKIERIDTRREILTGFKTGELTTSEASQIATKHGITDMVIMMDCITRLDDKEDYKFKLQGKRVWNDINISIENKKGSTRSGVDPDGKPWSIKMKYDYGRIPRTEGTDGDQIDVYVGPDKKSDLVFIVHQQDPWKKKYDEDKVFVGFGTVEQVKKAFLSQYDKPGFLGPIDTVSVEVFKDMIKDKSRKGKSIGSTKITDSITNLALGILIESEHTENINEAAKIATDHLKENPNYYLDPDNPFIEEAHKEIMQLKPGMMEEPVTMDASPLIELIITPLVRKLVQQLGFKTAKWMGKGWIIPWDARSYSKYAMLLPFFSPFAAVLKKYGYRIRLSMLGLFVESIK